jgi:hypothetical protein
MVQQQLPRVVRQAARSSAVMVAGVVSKSWLVF